MRAAKQGHGQTVSESCPQSVIWRVVPSRSVVRAAVRRGARIAAIGSFAAAGKSEAMKGARMSEKPTPRASELFMRKFLEERAEVRRMQHSGECDGSRRPTCYDECPHSAYCSEWRHTVRVPF